MTGKCDETVYPKERWGSLHGSKCNRPVKEGTKCGIHCASAKEKRDSAWKEKYEASRKKELANDIEMAIRLLTDHGFEVKKHEV